MNQRIAIVGAGLSGSMLAIRLLQTLRDRGTVTLVDAGAAFGPGLAYSTPHPRHQMNTPAGAVSAVVDEPAHFVSWLAGQGTVATTDRPIFARRHAYGRYLSETIDAAALRSDIALARIEAQAIGVERREGGFAVVLGDGTAIEADQVALCTGYGIRRPQATSRRVVSDPWANSWWERVAPDDAVIFKGAGLTMVDQVLRLTAAGHRGPMLAVSRRGLVPLPQKAVPAPPVAMADLESATSLRQLVRIVRAAASAAEDWRPVVDALRLRVQVIWQGLGAIERRRFRRHLRPFWDVHRHRMPPDAGREIAALLASGRLQICAGRIGTPVEEIGGLRVAFRGRRRTTKLLRAQWLVDCTGAEAGAVSGPLAWSLLGLGWAVCHGGRIALRVNPDSGVAGDDGRSVPGLYALGPPAREAFWEITAIPEIREQARQVAAAIANVAERATSGGAGEAADRGADF